MSLSHAPADFTPPAAAAATDLTTILHVRVVSGTGGGPDKTILNSPRFLVGSRFRALCAYLHPPNDPGFVALQTMAERYQAPLIAIPDRGPLDASVLAALLRCCREHGVNIWQAHDYKSNLLGLMLRPLWPMRLVTMVHGWVKHTSRTPMYYAIDKWCLPRYERVVCVSDDLYDTCRALGVRADRLAFVHNAIDFQEYSRTQSPPAARAALGWPADGLLIGAVGRLSPEKGFDLLIDAVGQLIGRGLNVRLVVVGDGDHRAALQGQIDARGHAERIWLAGHRSDMPQVFQALDIFALSSRREGLPNVVLEAMAMHVPLVATRVAGVPHLISHEENGLLVEMDDAAALAGALARLVESPALRQQLCERARATIEARYSFAKRMEKMVRVYDSLTQPELQLPAVPSANAEAQPAPDAAAPLPQVTLLDGHTLAAQMGELVRYARSKNTLGGDPTWLAVLAHGQRHQPYCVVARSAGQIVGILPLAYVRSMLFGRFLVSLPYVNSAGVLADTPQLAGVLIDAAVKLADRLNVRFLELRHEEPLTHPALNASRTDKVHMRLPLPDSADRLWSQLDGKVRNQVRKAQKGELTVDWGGIEQLDAFYAIFNQNMRDLGTPVFGRGLFTAILQHFGEEAELCTVRSGVMPVAAGLLIHGHGATEVPSASSLREYNSTNANMLMYWHLLQRAIERKQPVFDFGRCTPDGNVFKFKKQWGAQQSPAVWQYYLRQGSADDMRPTQAGFKWKIELWKKLPLAVTSRVGPWVARGIP